MSVIHKIEYGGKKQCRRPLGCQWRCGGLLPAFSDSRVQCYNHSTSTSGQPTAAHGRRSPVTAFLTEEQWWCCMLEPSGQARKRPSPAGYIFQQAMECVHNGPLQCLDHFLHPLAQWSSNFWHLCGELARENAQQVGKFGLNAAPVPQSPFIPRTICLNTQNKQTSGLSKLRQWGWQLHDS